MNINRNNYEEYFLLYADKELSADEKNMVDIFVKNNQDLQKEFLLLQESVVKPGLIELKDKSFLLKNKELQQDQYINKNNFEEKFLLYADNEMSLAEIEETERFVLSNISLQPEFTLLQRTKLQPDISIVFPDKSLLYKIKDHAKIIRFGWKAIAAAVLLGIGLSTGIIFLQQNKAQYAVTRPAAAPKGSPFKQPQKNNRKNITMIKNGEIKKVVPQNIVKNDFENSPKKQFTIHQKTTEKNIQSVSKAPVTTKINNPKNEDIVVNAPMEKKIISTLGNNPQKPVNNTLKAANPERDIETLQNNTALAASYIAEGNEKSQNYFFYNITQEQFNKSKLGVFFKKLKRSIQRKNPLREKTFSASSIAESPIN